MEGGEGMPPITSKIIDLALTGSNGGHGGCVGDKHGEVLARS